MKCHPLFRLDRLGAKPLGRIIDSLDLAVPAGALLLLDLVRE